MARYDLMLGVTSAEAFVLLNQEVFQRHQEPHDDNDDDHDDHDDDHEIDANDVSAPPKGDLLSHLN